MYVHIYIYILFARGYIRLLLSRVPTEKEKTSKFLDYHLKPIVQSGKS